MIVIVLLVVAGAFGNLIYGKVTRQYGGGKPFQAQFVVSKQFPTYLSNVLKVEKGLSAEVDILSETNSEFLIQTRSPDSNERISLRISRTLINAVIPVRPSKKPK